MHAGVLMITMELAYGVDREFTVESAAMLVRDRRRLPKTATDHELTRVTEFESRGYI